MKARIHLDTAFHRGEISPRIFSGFLEHLGRAVYGGVFEPGNRLSNRRGFRRDVLAALRPMRMPLVRYPGGNFVSNYRWLDGVGPRWQRPVRADYAWHSRETNGFGTDEFVAWCRQLGTAPLLAVNLGTAGAQEAADWVEYCNLPGGTHWSDLRRKHGHRQPHDVRVWCLGNEMDGPWQAGHVPAEEYARRALQAGKFMKGIDGRIELVACGSSGNGMPTYLSWDRTVLEQCWDTVDYISAHRYSNNDRQDSAWFLAEGVEIDRVLDDYAGLLAYVRGAKKSAKQVFLSFDEWNVWYKNRLMDGQWKVAPALLEEVYNLEDALVCAQYLNGFVRRADIVKIACLAQIVNVIAPILTRRNGLLLQSIYHPCVAFARHAAGRSLVPAVEAQACKAGDRGDVPALDASAAHDPTHNRLTVFLVNRDLRRELTVEIDCADRRVREVVGVEVLTGPNPKAASSWEQPDLITPRQSKAARVNAGRASVTVPPLAFLVVRLALQK